MSNRWALVAEMGAHAKEIGGSLPAELSQAERLLRSAFYSEAALRIGRALEAAIYAVSRECQVGLRNTVIRPLTAAQRKIEEGERHLLKSRDRLAAKDALTEAFEALRHTLELLAQPEQADMFDGEEDGKARNPQALIRDLCATRVDGDLKRRLKLIESQLTPIIRTRNAAAHASLDGCVHEVSEDECDRMLASANEILSGLYTITVGERARRAGLLT